MREAAQARGRHPGGLGSARPLAERRFEELGLYERLALRYLLVELVEAAATLCLYVIRELYGGDADGYPSCFLELARLDAIPQPMAEELARAARQGNLLVHRYWVVDDRRLHREAARGLRVFEDTVRDVDVAVWLRRGVDPLDYILEEGLRLERQLGLPVDIQVLNEAPPGFRVSVYRSGVPLVVRDPGFHALEKAKATLMYSDWRMLRWKVERLRRSSRNSRELKQGLGEDGACSPPGGGG